MTRLRRDRQHCEHGRGARPLGRARARRLTRPPRGRTTAGRLLAAAASFVAVFFFCQLSGDASDGIALLYVVPVALTALELGLRAGLAAGALATALTALWAATG